MKYVSVPSQTRAPPPLHRTDAEYPRVHICLTKVVLSRYLLPKFAGGKPNQPKYGQLPNSAKIKASLYQNVVPKFRTVLPTSNRRRRCCDVMMMRRRKNEDVTTPKLFGMMMMMISAQVRHQREKAFPHPRPQMGSQTPCMIKREANCEPIMV